MELLVKEKINIYQNLISDLLFQVQKPGQYLGIEWGHLIEPAVREQPPKARELGVREKQDSGKTWGNTKVHSALIYPDLYELGMSNFGTKILYQIINAHQDFLCDRAYAPMKDMENLIRKNQISLWGWESLEPLNNFDLLGFSLSYELNYTNVLNILNLCSLETLSKDRKEIFPLVFAGGPAVFNPEPMAEFIDFFIIGDGEEVIIEVLNLIKDCRDVVNHVSTFVKEDILLKLAQIPGIYVPRFYEPDPNYNYLPKRIKNDVPEKITKRVVNLSDYNQPISGPVPYLASVQDRQVLEIRRGCDRGCRFCQPGYVYLPVRERTPENLLELSKQALKNTGYDEYSLLSLSASDYTQLHELSTTLNNCHSQKGISLSMPSQRADRFDMAIANELNSVRKSGITLAPEAGTERLRAIINKGLKENDIKRAIENVYDSGFHHVKLYFMIGLPTETKEDLEGIIQLLLWACNLSKIKNKKPLDITCTISTFVPKAFTPFQWFSQNSQEEFEGKIQYLKQRIRELRLYKVKLNCTDPKIALLEANLSRGDRRFSRLIYLAYTKGAKFDAWDEYLNIDFWHKAAEEINLDLNFEATKQRNIEDLNPWEIIDTGLLKKFLIKEWNDAIKVSETSACTENTCHACGVCFELGVLNEVSTDRSKNNKFVKEISHPAPPKGRGSPNKVGRQPSAIPPLQRGEARPTRLGGSHQPSAKKELPTKTVQKVEIIHTKKGNLKFISHLDLQRLFERALRRAEIPLSFSEGFNPRPKMQWICPLPIYYESDFELMHLELSELVNLADLQIGLNKQLPTEIQAKSIKNVDLTKKVPNIENIKVLYKVLTRSPLVWEKYICDVELNIKSFLEQKSLILKVFKNNQEEKEIDIRKLVENVWISNKELLEIKMIVLGNTRPEMILNQLTPQSLVSSHQIHDLKLWQSNWWIIKEGLLMEGRNEN